MQTAPESADRLVTFLPHRLNRQPVIVRGLTADELWACAAMSGAVGLAVGIPVAWLSRTLAMAPTCVAAAVVLGIFVGGGFLRRQKRGRPETWLYRYLQWWLAVRHPGLASLLGAHGLVTRTGWWTVRRSRECVPR